MGVSGFDKKILVDATAITGCASPVISGVHRYLQTQNLFLLAFNAGFAQLSARKLRLSPLFQFVPKSA